MKKIISKFEGREIDKEKLGKKNCKNFKHIVNSLKRWNSENKSKSTIFKWSRDSKSKGFLLLVIWIECGKKSTSNSDPIILNTSSSQLIFWAIIKIFIM